MEKVRGLRAFKIRESPFLIFFILLLAVFSALFLRPDFVGSDTYGYLLISCKNVNVAEVPGIQFIAFRLLPCDFFVLKALLFCLCFVSGAAVIKMATLFSPKNGWRASYLLFLTSAFVLEFSKLENDQLAFPLLFASQYLFFKAVKTGDREAGLDSLMLVFAAAVLWQGAIFYLIGYALNVWLLALLAIPAIALYGQKIVASVIRSAVVAEDMPFQFHVHFLLNFGLLGATLSPLLLPQALFFFALGVASAKFWVLSTPLLAVGAVLLLERLDSKFWHDMALCVSLVCAVALFQSVLMNPPQPSHWDAINFAMERASTIDRSAWDENGKLDAGAQVINNDWGMGYWVKWKGGETASYMSPAQQQEFSKGQVVVSEQELACPLLKEFGKVRVYKC